MSAMQHGYKSKGIHLRKNIYGEQWTVGKRGKGPEERRGDMRGAEETKVILV